MSRSLVVKVTAGETDAERCNQAFTVASSAVAALPEQTTSWSATGIGRSTLAVALASLAKGGHLRVGMEDVLTLAKGVPVEHNEQLVDRAAQLGRLAQRTPMSPAEARELLQVRPR